ncbi:Ribonuclease MRP protein subunit RMP1 [Candida viswanathii]|uniref:Ribonuclease MRP protein subunit RMP1 n=1 Tax=Candida viswanathii TaxID=5486 RepID=A0A367YE65_9ASCO|nr:Ribonuclease MRP protein subunit RMP1 [Candida viswanathii]
MDKATYESLVREYNGLFLLHHKSKNQHHHQKWFTHLNIILRTLRKIIKLQIDTQRTKRDVKRTEFKKKQIVALANKVITVSRDAYWAYNSILALGQYITLGFALVASLAKVYSLMLSIPGVNAKKPQLIASVSNGNVVNGTGEDDLGEEIPFEDGVASRGSKETILKHPQSVSIKMGKYSVPESEVKMTLSFRNTYKMPKKQWDKIQRVLQQSLKRLEPKVDPEFDVLVISNSDEGHRPSAAELHELMQEKVHKLEAYASDYMKNKFQEILWVAKEIKTIMFNELRKLPKNNKGEINANQQVVAEFTKWYQARETLIKDKLKGIEGDLASHFDSLWKDYEKREPITNSSVSVDGSGLNPKDRDVTRKRKNESINDIFGSKKSKKELKPDKTTKPKKKKKKGSAIDDIFG